ncbi:MAG: nucleotidyltransferase family protein [Candidatus Omnitrophica bacterium]|nr:nucleotidyltransferase family protein [Candidatus Omnitrophota bacterium]
MSEIIPEINLIKFIVGHIVGNKKQEINDLLTSYSIDWGKFKSFIIYHDLTPFSYSALKDFNSFLPHDLETFLKNNYYCALVRCQKLWQEFLRIYDLFEQAGVILLPIKGVALLEDLYANNYLRPMTDIDLLVKEEDLQKAETIFGDLGYRKELYGLKQEYWREKQIHFTFYKKKKDEKAPFIELHWNLDFKRKNRNILPGLWERIREINADGRKINLLSPEDTLFSLALHNRRFGRTLCLKNAYDTVVLLNKYTVGFDWDYVLKQAKKGKMRAALFFILTQAEILLEQKMPTEVWHGLGIPRYKQRLIRRFIQRNTFLPAKKADGKELYLKSHFLLYDSFWEPTEYIFNIPKEQFAKYYGLSSYDKKTDFLYKNRLFYIPYKAITCGVTNAKKARY